MEILLFLLVVGIFLFFCFRSGFNAGKKERLKRLAELQKRETVYHEALNQVTASPKDPSIRVRVLELGRSYYEMKIPNTYTQHSRGGSSDYQNNSAAREAAINADIEARIGHLKVA